ncbi:chorismate mutase [Paenibacillus glycanilyticus]|uniref:chorismate mutase n=1 Tax=Paenibacillus glycanilyticus TaxID=126569 RepID=UPI00203BD2BF|nr:chorismate mutase [Paenibacillus glycanilyticus]MCM3628595.1 chorismate mutase [Paenibacillus glycanilyticus]
MTALEGLRSAIDKTDQQIVALLAQRFIYTEAVGEYKAANQLHSQDPSREEQQFKKIVELSEQYGLRPEYAVDIYRRIMDIVISRHQELQADKAV